MTHLKRGLTHQIMGGMLWTTWGKGAYGLLQLLILGVLARLLSPADFGIVNAALIVTGFSAIFSHLGLGPALVQRATLEPRHVDTAFVVSVSFGLALCVIVWVLAPLGAMVLGMPSVVPVLRVLACIFPMKGLGAVAESLAARDLRFRWLANVDVISYALGYGLVGVTLAMLGWGVWALVAGQLAQTVLRTAMLLVDHPPGVRRAGQQAFRELMYFGSGFTVARIANYAAIQGDNLIVGRFLGPGPLGYYGRAYQLMSAPAYGFGTILDAVLFPAMAKVQDNLERLAAAYRRGVALIALLVLPPSLPLVFLAPEVIRLVLGPQWAEVVAPFQILAIGMLFRTSYKMSDSLARATGAVYRRAWRQVLYAALVIGGAWIGQHWGISGVAWGTLAAVTVNFFLMAGLSLDVAGMTWRSFWRAHVPAVLLTIVGCVLVWSTASVLRGWGASPLLVVTIACGTALAGVAAFVALVPAAALGEDGLWMLRTLQGYVPKLRRRQSRAEAAPPVSSTAVAGEQR